MTEKHPHSQSSAHGKETSDTGDGRGHRQRDYSEAPLVVTWEASQACSLSCDHCRADAQTERHPNELTTREAKDLFEQVREFSPQPFFVVSGGDPLERGDMFELLEAAAEKGLRPSITPATTPSLDAETVDRLDGAGVSRMAVSIDGATPKSHDDFRGEEGTFERAIEAAENARETGISVQVNTTVTASTVDELPGIASIVDDLDAAMWEVFFLVPVGRGEGLSQISSERARKVAEYLYGVSKESSFRVITVEAPFYRRVAREADGGRVGSTGAGDGFVFVSHTGEVYPSGFLPVSVGNVRDTSLPELYRNGSVMKRLRNHEMLEDTCGDCYMSEECGGSRSRAYAETGRLTASDPLCPWVNG